MYKLPELKYGYADLEPYIDEETMRLHHTKHHQAYIDKLNSALDTAPEINSQPLEDLLSNLESVPESIRQAVRNQGGGHFNHNLWWEIIGPAGSGPQAPEGDLAEAVNESFGSFENLQTEMKNKGLGLFGSGWVWLVTDQSKKLSLVTTTNQDTPLAQNLNPLLGIDIWEHAYYLKYQNRRSDYLEAVTRVLNWDKISQRFSK